MEEARLDGLLSLLTEGCSMAIRLQAAEEIARLTTAANLPYLLVKLRPLLRDDEWDSRVASAQTVGLIAALPWVRSAWLPACADIARGDAILRLDDLDVDHLLAHAAPLLRSGGEEYDYTVEFATVEEQQAHLALQRRRLWGRLRRSIGTDVPAIALESTRANTSHVVSDADLVASAPPVICRTPTAALFSTAFSAASSARTSFAGFPLLVLDCLEAVFDARWEVRHGAAHVLRDLFATTDANDATEATDAWLEEVLARGLGVLALEAWVDYAADGAVAPVRELVAQLVGRLLRRQPAHVARVVPLLRAASWHAAHGGLLALYYCGAAALPVDVYAAVADCVTARSEEEVHAIAAHVLASAAAAPFVSRCVHRLWQLLDDKQQSLVDAAPGPLLRCLQVHRALWPPELPRQLHLVLAYTRHAMATVRTTAQACLATLVAEPLGAALAARAAQWGWFVLVTAEATDVDAALTTWQALWAAQGGVIDTAVVADELVPLWLRTLWAVSEPTWPLPTPGGALVVPVTPRRLPLATTLVLCSAVGTVANALPPEVRATVLFPPLTTLLESDRGQLQLSGLWIFGHLHDVPAAGLAFATDALARPRRGFFAEQAADAAKLRRLHSRLLALFAAASPLAPPDDWGVDTALALATAAGALPFDTLAQPEPYTTAQFLRQDIFALEERLRTGFIALGRRIRAAAASVVYAGRRWTKPGLLLRPWMDCLKEEEAPELRAVVVSALAAFVAAHRSAHTAACAKVVNNLINSVVAVDPSTPVTLEPATPTTPLDVRIAGARTALAQLLPLATTDIAERVASELAAPPATDARLQGLCRLLHLIVPADAHTLPTLCAWSRRPWAPASHALLAAVLAAAAPDALPNVLDHVLPPGAPDATLALLAAMAATPERCLLHLPRLVAAALRVLCNDAAAARPAAAVLATLVPLLPLLPPATEPAQMFLANLLRGTPPPVDLPAVGVAWRPYQVHGIRWLVFLANHGLHAVLADDMGLGKTLQVLAAVAIVTAAAQRRLLVVAPPVVLEHWKREAVRVLGDSVTVVVSTGPAATRTALRRRHMAAGAWRDQTLVLTTYAYLQRDIDHFAATTFDYCVADEAHLVRNLQSQHAVALRQVRATHRVALTGTPLQNSVADLFALFEFVLPGYLGPWGDFRATTLAPIQAAKSDAATKAQKEAGAVALARLHARVQPFVLRRTKEHVLAELPPKIITDVVCELPPAQKAAYDACASRGAPGLHQLSELQKLCVHPALVGGDDTELSGKFLALKELLDTHAEAGHRFLVFCHLQATLDLLATTLRAHCSALAFERLDGSVPTNQRQSIVDRFNSDVQVQVLLLTTAVGGLGLTLTGADTVVFMEHSWNPFVDLQAMDRAHRLGQTRTVTVYRLLAKDTVEEAVMSCQRFKTAMAAAVVGADGAAGTGSLAPPPTAPRPAKRSKGLDALLEEMGELWDDAQYATLERTYAAP
ncbi:hypothetical protein ACHHYP_04570 [Achlya hypogyna]|uniref:TATA-binding protein-associated factor n=1 Tax=Achlya hypogyna TaxID=1202772 RepID=A0A1V9Z0W6_ACHHY|nr:hypothetical protein ACHHYP_04570 [Achlya hypogyna]